MIRTTILFLAFLTSFGVSAQLSTTEVDYNKFIKDISNTSAGGNELEICIWMPSIYWRIIADQNPGVLTRSDVSEAVDPARE